MKLLSKIFEKEEMFEAFTYIYKDGTVALPYQITEWVRWLKDIPVTGPSHKIRKKRAFELFRSQNNLKMGQVWLSGNYISKSKGLKLWNWCPECKTNFFNIQFHFSLKSWINVCKKCRRKSQRSN